MLPHFEVIPHQDITNYNTFSIWHLPLSTWIGYESKFLFYYNTTGMSTNFIQVWYSSLTKVLSCWEPIFESSPYKIYHLGRHIWIPHEGKKCDWVVKYIVAHVKTYMMSSHYIPHYHLLVTPIYPPFANALVHFQQQMKSFYHFMLPGKPIPPPFEISFSLASLPHSHIFYKPLFLLWICKKKVYYEMG